jgi:hypothetical protein
MNTVLRTLAASCLSAALAASLPAQTTITAADVGAQLAPGATFTSHVDTSHTIDIGAPGATSWDFSGLTQGSGFTFLCVDPDTTPFAPYFPGATHCTRVVVPGSGTIYTYLQLGTDLLSPGTGVIGFFQQRTMKHPAETQMKLPMTFGTSWSSTTVDSSIITSPPVTTVSTQEVSYDVDAYGTLTLPGGGSHDALRIRIDRRVTSGVVTVRTISYQFISADGASANVVAADTAQPNSGAISASSVTWNGPTLTGIVPDAPVPAQFRLGQNYPNPFNPSTEIGFDLPSGSFVTLIVTDVLGRTVATLVNGGLPPGSYREPFDAGDLPGGVYFCRLTADGSSLVTKMLLLR